MSKPLNPQLGHESAIRKQCCHVSVVVCTTAAPRSVPASTSRTIIHHCHDASLLIPHPNATYPHLRLYLYFSEVRFFKGLMLFEHLGLQLLKSISPLCERFLRRMYKLLHSYTAEKHNITIIIFISIWLLIIRISHFVVLKKTNMVAKAFC